MTPTNADLAMLETRTPLLKTVLAWTPRQLLGYVTARPLLVFTARIVVLLAVFMFVDYFMRRAGDIGADGYARRFLIVGTYERLGGWVVIGLVLITAVLARYGALLDRWRSLDAGHEIRWFIVFLAAIMAWPFSTYEYNYFFDQGHYLERAAIVLLVPLIYLRPVFLFPFLLLAFSIMWQINEPSLAFGSVFPHKLQVLHVLNLFAAAFLLHAITGARQTKDFVLFTCCLVGAAYWVSVFNKWQLDWLTHGHLYHMLIAAWSHGWLAFLDSTTVVDLAKGLAWLDIPMMLFVLAFQTAFLLVLWRRTLSLVLLVASIAFHLGVFALYGYFFWTWMLLNAALFVLLYRDRKEKKFDIYRPRYLLVSVLLIATGSYWCKPSGLAWLDTKLTYTYRIDAVGSSGQAYLLPPSFFAPYDSIITMGNFRYIVPDFGPLVGPYGIARARERADEILPLETADEVFALEREVAEIGYDPAHAAEFYDFIVRYVQNRTKSPGRAAIFRAVGPPPQFWSFGRGAVYDGQEPIRQVVVTSVTRLFDGERIDVIREHELARIDIGDE